MCVPVTVATKGQVTGCTGLCRVWPQVIGMVTLAAVFAWNFVTGRKAKKATK